MAETPGLHPSFSGQGHDHHGAGDTTTTEEQVRTVRSHLEPEHNAAADDATVKRFIRATGGNLTLSAKRLNHTLAWRRDTKPETIVCTACAANPKSHYMHVAGYDSLRRPIIYSCLALATNKDYEDNTAHMIQTFEHAIKCMPPGVEQWVWVCDFWGFSMADINPKLAKSFLDLSADHYPERLGLFVVLDAPALFNVLWRAISAFVDPKTYTKIRFLPYDTAKGDHSKLTSELAKHLEPDTLQWLLTEMGENRVKAVAQSKVYCVTEIHKSASEGSLVRSCEPSSADDREEAASSLAGPVAAALAACSVSASEDASTTSSHPGKAAARAASPAINAQQSGSCTGRDHDHRGTRHLLEHYSTCPHLLEPQAKAKV